MRTNQTAATSASTSRSIAYHCLISLNISIKSNLRRPNFLNQKDSKFQKQMLKGVCNCKVQIFSRLFVLQVAKELTEITYNRFTFLPRFNLCAWTTKDILCKHRQLPFLRLNVCVANQSKTYQMWLFHKQEIALQGILYSVI